MRKSRHALRIYKSRIKFFFTAFLITLVLCFIYWFIFFSFYFQIKEVSVEGFKQSLSEEIELYLAQNNKRFVPFLIYSIFPQCLENNKSFFTFFISDLKSFILKKHPEIEEISIKTDIKNGLLSVLVKQRSIDFLWCFGEHDCYYLDKNGIIFEKSPEISGSFIKKIVYLKEGNQEGEAYLGQNVISPDKLEKLNKIFILSQEKDNLFSVKSLKIKTDDISNIEIITDNGFSIFYNLNSDFAEIIKIIQEIKNQYLQENFSSLEYINCRYLPKVYYKLK